MPFGTRPEIVKLAPVVRALRAAGHDVHTVATGQHWDQAMAGSFFERLELVPDERWEPVADATEGERVGAILSGAFRTVAAAAVDAVMVLGDTYTVPLFALAARRHGVPVVHLEAGLRSFNARSMEEVNRRIAAATASLHLAPTELAAGFLRGEGVPPERIKVVGNPAIDALRELGVRPVPVAERSGVVVTAHRASNVDDDHRLRLLVDLVGRLCRDIGRVTFPLHPRTRARLEATGLITRLQGPQLDLTEPLDFKAMLASMARARLVVTDSGGIQEEASWLGVPVVVLRHSTPRWEGVIEGVSALAGLDGDAVLDAARRFTTAEAQQRIACAPCLYGDGRTGQAVAVAIGEAADMGLLRLDEPVSPQVPAEVFAASLALADA